MPLLHRSRVPAALAAAALLVLTGCGSGDDGSADTAAAVGDSAAFPVTIEHALGETTVDEAPTRVVTWGFGSTDAALALGVVPVAIPFQAYGGNEEGLLPWIEDAVDAAVADGAEEPTILPEGDDVPFEAIAAADPDVILANYSGITQEDYDLLADIAPTVAYPDQPWTTPWRDVVTTTGQALGLADEAEQLVADTDQQIADAAAAHPELQGRTVAAVWDSAGTFYVYQAADPRVEFLTDLGLEIAPSVEELATDEASFYYTLSYETVSSLTSDVLLTYAADEAESETFLSSTQGQSMEQVQAGRVATIIGTPAVSAVSPPTVLSLPWGLDDYVTALSGAVAA